ncbi:DUF3786 domain-containing protein [Desulfocapsa sp. AH-315-G09]|uniref:DUF3786 domain-containing protein n=1 Tax=Desulfotalea psychrophila TaxID=84980 RepID=A0ABS3ASL4_9BACT|nr:DUF3786 domain-containing protein [Desulfocapsa sp.]MBN4063895.1 DUF3786 domain-containing protein [bacterium AH-315-I07]MBN4065025.1 DUF3786 domain-containing protein [Desulfocapsa sp. AH-315-G09]MBN4068106.1 DUF3786 domain-containing protein [Desulfotalea psychrophila]
MTDEKLLTPLEVYKMLEKTNCKQCMLPSCLAFAVAVIGGQKHLDDCPHLTRSVKNALSGNLQKRSTADPLQPEFLEKLLQKVQALDFTAVAQERGCDNDADVMRVTSLGKDFYVDRNGVVRSQCHIIPWVEVPLLSYLCHSSHQQISGRWISFREIKGGIDWRGLFQSRCEIPLRLLADRHPELLSDIVELFQGKEVEGFDADIALVVHPFPHIPILLCYQAADGDMESELNIFFDECCAMNLHIKSLYTLCAGLVKMFEKIALNHY